MDSRGGGGVLSLGTCGHGLRGVVECGILNGREGNNLELFGEIFDKSVKTSSPPPNV